MQKVADRLYAEHTGQEVDWEALGRNDAKIWVESATLKDFQYLFKNLSVSKRRGEPVRVHSGMPSFLSNFGTVFAAGATFDHRHI
jgi:hypothetical protein